mmetsp:Transcript_22086/g.46640  ORF Transcript_22086/g.46640 Transcript_22086/m.46640 type:complete len:207 (-) Transcript_22086:645-1265(-)
MSCLLCVNARVCVWRVWLLGSVRVGVQICVVHPSARACTPVCTSKSPRVHTCDAGRGHGRWAHYPADRARHVSLQPPAGDDRRGHVARDPADGACSHPARNDATQRLRRRVDAHAGSRARSLTQPRPLTHPYALSTPHVLSYAHSSRRPQAVAGNRAFRCESACSFTFSFTLFYAHACAFPSGHPHAPCPVMCILDLTWSFGRFVY